MAYSLRSRPPVGSNREPTFTADPDVFRAYLEDAAHFPGGHTPMLFAPNDEQEIAHVLQAHTAVLPIGAQSSLTGGATPLGEALLSTKRLNRIEEIGSDTVRVQAGVTLAALDAALARVNRYYPPSPTFAGAFVGGTVSTNAAGAGTFKYGTTREWVQALTVVLPDGDVLDVERGVTHAHAGGYFELVLARRDVRVPVPTYQMPRVLKLSAGYFAAPDMDLIDLFIGAEGTLGVVTAITLRVLPVRPAFCRALVTFDAVQAGLRFVEEIRQAAVETWRTRRPDGLDVSAIEHWDGRCTALLRDDGIDRVNSVPLPEDTSFAVLVTLELPPETTAEMVFEQIGSVGRDVPASPMGHFCEMVAAHAALDRVAIAVPGDERRASELLNVREGVPAAVNQRVGRAKRSVDPKVEKVAADVIVPFGRIGDLLDFCTDRFERARLDAAVWGHISDGNLHPNVIPRSLADVQAGKEAVLDIGRRAIDLGGAPLAEHGVGRNPIKQQLLMDLYGANGIAEMRRVKEAIDPAWKLAPGVLFSI